MAELIAIAYPDEFKAQEVLNTLRRLQSEYLIQMQDACTVTKDNDGKVHLHQAVNLTAAGAVSGAFWGTLIGLLFFAPLLGTAVGAASGALAGSLSDYGIDDQFVKELSNQMQPGSSALFVLVGKVTPDKVVAEVSKYGGTILRSSLTEEQQAKLQEALNAGAASAGS